MNPLTPLRRDSPRGLSPSKIEHDEFSYPLPPRRPVACIHEHVAPCDPSFLNTRIPFVALFAVGLLSGTSGNRVKSYMRVDPCFLNSTTSSGGRVRTRPISNPSLFPGSNLSLCGVDISQNSSADSFTHVYRVHVCVGHQARER